MSDKAEETKKGIREQEARVWKTFESNVQWFLRRIQELEKGDEEELPEETIQEVAKARKWKNVNDKSLKLVRIKWSERDISYQTQDLQLLSLYKLIFLIEFPEHMLPEYYLDVDFKDALTVMAAIIREYHSGQYHIDRNKLYAKFLKQNIGILQGPSAGVLGMMSLSELHDEDVPLPSEVKTTREPPLSPPTSTLMLPAPCDLGLSNAVAAPKNYDRGLRGRAIPSPSSYHPTMFPFTVSDPPATLFCNILDKEYRYGLIRSQLTGPIVDQVNRMSYPEAWRFCDEHIFIPSIDALRSQYGSGKIAHPIETAIKNAIAASASVKDVGNEGGGQLARELEIVVKKLNNIEVQLISLGKVKPVMPQQAPVFVPPEAQPAAVEPPPLSVKKVLILHN